jgi:hypothetical protein
MADLYPSELRHRFRQWKRSRRSAPPWVFWVALAVLLAVPVALAIANVGR